MDGSSSQLTEHGLCSLQQGLRPNELAVFFRNNHFNTLFLHKGVLHILVTDQGYEFEKVMLHPVSMSKAAQKALQLCYTCRQQQVHLSYIIFHIASYVVVKTCLVQHQGRVLLLDFAITLAHCISLAFLYNVVSCRLSCHNVWSHQLSSAISVPSVTTLPFRHCACTKPKCSCMQLHVIASTPARRATAQWHVTTA